jgi:hypothetical protein
MEQLKKGSDMPALITKGAPQFVSFNCVCVWQINAGDEPRNVLQFL